MWKKLRGRTEKYLPAALIILVGIVLLCLPSAAKKNKTADKTEHGDVWEVEATEEKLEKLLSQVEGAGTVQVMLSPETGEERVLAENHEEIRRDGDATLSREVVVTEADTGEEPVTLRVVYPFFRGAVVVAEGAGDPTVALALTRAVSAVTGLGTDRITVIKGKGA